MSIKTYLNIAIYSLIFLLFFGKMSHANIYSELSDNDAIRLFLNNNTTNNDIEHSQYVRFFSIEKKADFASFLKGKITAKNLKDKYDPSNIFNISSNELNALRLGQARLSYVPLTKQAKSALTLINNQSLRNNNDLIFIQSSLESSIAFNTNYSRSKLTCDDPSLGDPQQYKHSLMVKVRYVGTSLYALDLESQSPRYVNPCGTLSWSISDENFPKINIRQSNTPVNTINRLVLTKQQRKQIPLDRQALRSMHIFYFKDHKDWVPEALVPIHIKRFFDENDQESLAKKITILYQADTYWVFWVQLKVVAWRDAEPSPHPDR